MNRPTRRWEGPQVAVRPRAWRASLRRRRSELQRTATRRSSHERVRVSKHDLFSFMSEYQNLTHSHQESTIQDSSPERVVWITGAAGGLGVALTAEFVRQGFHVAATYHRKPLASAHEPRFRSGDGSSPDKKGTGSPRPGGLESPCAPEFSEPGAFHESLRLADQILALPGDVTNPEQIAGVLDAILNRWGRLDVLVNNAGLVSDQWSWQLPEKEWDAVISANLKGAFLCARAALTPMTRQTGGHIINIGSLVGIHGAAGQANYAAAKAGLLGFSAALAKEMGSHNVQVNSILPGLLRTPMTNRMSAERWNSIVTANALGRLNTVEEIARFAGFLTTLQNVSGQVFQLDSRVSRWS
jgi:3-oxoacyl-[acyl-carrier protein] reductase